MINSEEQYRECKQFAKLLEENSFSKLKKYLESLKASDVNKYHHFYEYINDLSLWSEISQQKISLAKFVTEQSKVVAFQDDRTRIVLQLAQLNGKELKDINSALVNEFGDYFQMFPVYVTGDKKLTYQEITKRAAEIRNGLRNICYLGIEDTAEEVMIYFKGNTVNDKEKLLQLRDATFSLMQKMRDASAFISSGVFKEIKPEIITYYKLTNRTELDVKSLDDPDFDDIAKFVYMMAEIVSIKLKLIERGFAPNDLVQAKKIILDNLARIEFNKYTSVEEMERIGMPLPRAK